MTITTIQVHDVKFVCNMELSRFFFEITLILIIDMNVGYQVVIRLRIIQ